MSIGIMDSKSFILIAWLRFKVIQQQGTRKKDTRACAVLIPSTILKHLEVQSSNRKNYHYPQ